jgi:two-component system, cell cycle sensor histidine kinase and response regulator CckA
VNLVVNASDAMPEGGRVTIATTETTLDEHYFRLHPAGRGMPGRYVMLEVSDTGIGMDEETVAHVFEPFFTTKGADGGTGLGLATVYGIVRQARGFVWAYSEVGRGTTFKVYFPVVTAAVAAAEPSREPEALLGAAGRTVLLVEDDEPVRAVVRRMLDAHGFSILEAREGGEALALSEAQDAGSIDLLLADTVIPGPGGTELAKRVRLRHPDARTLIMSGYSAREATVDVSLVPGTDFIAKPFSASDLNAKLAALLDDATPSAR